jgi:SAM-dependent methyltransferase
MQPDEHRRMYRLEDDHWWFVGRRGILQVLLEGLRLDAARTTILDVGCGTGANFAMLRRFGRVVGSDAFPTALDLCRERGFTNLCGADAGRLPLPPGAVDIVTAFEVFEHLADDVAALGEVHRVLRTGGRLLLTVPAHPFLWSDHDRALDHHRRYTRRLLTRRLADAGFAIDRLTYCFTLLFPPAAAIRLLERVARPFRPTNGTPRPDVRETAPWLSRMLLSVLACEAALLRRVNLPFGLTLAAVARKA